MRTPLLLLIATVLELDDAFYQLLKDYIAEFTYYLHDTSMNYENVVE
ncbi:MAG: hypothetical protein LBG30_05965 [Odoribacteraceae bacterium]|jgi:hypothetical protein|nr:hypothetical protein [Odoribacteraceae bacterium]